MIKEAFDYILKKIILRRYNKKINEENIEKIKNGNGCYLFMNNLFFQCINVLNNREENSRIEKEMQSLSDL